MQECVLYCVQHNTFSAYVEVAARLPRDAWTLEMHGIKQQRTCDHSNSLHNMIDKCAMLIVLSRKYTQNIPHFQLIELTILNPANSIRDVDNTQLKRLSC